MKVACTVWVQGKIRENPTYAHMNTENSTDLQNYYLNDLFRIMNKIVDISADGDYIYRGEPECYPEISSTLYRDRYAVLKLGSTSIKSSQKSEIEKVKTYLRSAKKKILKSPPSFGIMVVRPTSYILQSIII